MQKSSINRKRHESQNFARRQILNTNHSVRRSLTYKKVEVSTSSDESVESLVPLDTELDSPTHRPTKKFSLDLERKKHEIFQALQLSASKRKRTPHRLEQSGNRQPARIQAENFVMKLFDRSLDLSKYSEQNALYPICRAWMANQPRNPNVRNYEKNTEKKILRENNGDEILRKLKSGEMKEVIIWPLPKPAPPGLLRFPKGASIRNPEDDKPEKWENATRAEMLAMHKPHWKTIKSNWIKQNRIYDHHRYGVIYKILDHLYKNN